MTSTYTPFPNSLAHRVCCWFRANPAEELSTADIALKFEESARNVQAKLTAAVEAQLLSATKDDHGRLTWSAGTELQHATWAKQADQGRPPGAAGHHQHGRRARPDARDWPSPGN
jgi:hypothetical protein